MSEKERWILELRKQGLGYTKIARIIGSTRANVAYYIRPNGRQNSLERSRRHRAKEHPYSKKIEAFNRIKSIYIKPPAQGAVKYLIKCKTYAFQSRKLKIMPRKTNLRKFQVKDVLEKFGPNPVCYITGEQLDIMKPETYHFDHIIPRAIGGDNSLENLGICTKTANQSKHDMSYEDFVEFCRKVVKHHDEKVTLEGL